MNNLTFEETIAGYAVSALNELGLAGVSARFVDEITDENIQVLFETEGNLEEAVSLVENYRKYNAYEGTLGFIVSTNRAKIRNHSDKLAKIRFLMMPENEHLQNEYYQILETKETNASTDVDEQNNSDVTSIAFSVKFLLLT